MGCGVNVPRPENMPFKIFNMWCTDPNFRDIVKASWEIPIWGHSIFILTQKLKKLKATLKKWNKEVFGNITSKVEMESKNLERMQNQFETETMTEEFIEMMVEQEKKVELLLQQEQMFWRQKSKTQWDNDNDRSTKFFHAMVNRNKSKSLISEMKNEDGGTLVSRLLGAGVLSLSAGGALDSWLLGAGALALRRSLLQTSLGAQKTMSLKALQGQGGDAPLDNGCKLNQRKLN
ncbi:hypothetical protein IFM89_006593 [Coptis chinensis]|uniref:Uncharacterized protein n=1 Tax=Coptis chinensis TaxID=261450 RepID=A0A835MD57_9MAGN|nr:hypothetical protein IFM89_006593 [Coptis chinensis]